MRFTFSLDTVISLAALAASIYSICRTNWLDKYSIEVTSFESELSRGQILFGFVVTNTSTRVLKVNELKMYLNGKELKPLNIDVDEYDKKHTRINKDPYRNQILVPSVDERIDFEKPSIISPGDNFAVRQYFKHCPDTVELVADHRIKGFKKTKSFAVNNLNLNNVNDIQNQD